MKAFLTSFWSPTNSSLRKNTIETFARQLLAALAQLLTTILIARRLGADGNGAYVMALLLPTMLTTFLNMGVGTATVYFVAQKAVTPNQAVRENYHLALLVSVAGLLVGSLAVTIWGDLLFPGVPSSLLLCSGLIFPASLISAYWSAVLQGVEDFRAYNLSVLAPPLITLVATSFALLVFPPSLLFAIYAYLVGQFFGTLFIFFRVKPYLKDIPHKNFTLNYKQTILTYGIKTHLANIMAFVNYRADIFLVNFFMTPAATGIYALAVQLSERLWMLSQSLSTVLLPQLSATRTNSKERYKMVIQSGIIIGIITFISSIFLLIALYFLLEPIFGREYRESFTPFLWLIPGIVFGASSRIYSNGIAAFGRPELNFYISIIVVLVNIFGNIMLIPKYGVNGAAFSTTLAYTINTVLKFLQINKLLSVKKSNF
ncbi:MAG: flippase [Candidatus Moranbacteria bacterium]|nr:flippase [Candidatus Moranbacteria bacterium]